MRGSKECTKNQFDGRYRHSTTQSLAGNWNNFDDYEYELPKPERTIDKTTLGQ